MTAKGSLPAHASGGQTEPQRCEEACVQGSSRGARELSNVISVDFNGKGALRSHGVSRYRRETNKHNVTFEQKLSIRGNMVASAVSSRVSGLEVQIICCAHGPCAIGY